MDQIEQVAREHTDITRRYFLQFCAMGVAAPDVLELCAQNHKAEVVLPQKNGHLFKPLFSAVHSGSNWRTSKTLGNI